MSPANPTPTVFGIPNCDTVRRARAWLSGKGVAHTFHDFRRQGLAPEVLEQWLAAVGWETLLNRKGTTWRGLDEATRSQAVDAASAARLLLAHPSLIRRPVVQWAHGDITVGFDAQQWAARI